MEGPQRGRGGKREGVVKHSEVRRMENIDRQRKKMKVKDDKLRSWGKENEGRYKNKRIVKEGKEKADGMRRRSTR